MSDRGEWGTSTKAPKITKGSDIVAWFMTSFGGTAPGHHFEGLHLNSLLGKIWGCYFICYMNIKKWWKCKFSRGLPVMGAGDVLFYTGSTLNSAQVLPTCSMEGSRYSHHCHLCPNTTSCLGLPAGWRPDINTPPVISTLERSRVALVPMTRCRTVLSLLGHFFLSSHSEETTGSAEELMSHMMNLYQWNTIEGGKELVYNCFSFHLINFSKVL